MYAFAPPGVRTSRAAYASACERLHLDAIALVDGGTDMLCRSDESALGTPVEELTGVAAVAAPDRDGACPGAFTVPGGRRAVHPARQRQ